MSSDSTWTPEEFRIHLKKQNTKVGKGLSPSGSCCRLSMASLQGDKLQGPLRLVSSLSFPKCPSISLEKEKREKSVSGFYLVFCLLFYFY